jgi:predicted dehydrogenase
MKNETKKTIGRRNFLKLAGAAIVLPTFLPGCVLGRGGKTPPSGKINLGVVGWGWQGPGNTKSFLAETDCRVIAACDLDKDHLADAVNTINEHYENKDCTAYHDFREMMARDDLDAVMLAVPDHWHELVATHAARRKLDIYGEKPLAKTIAEQQAIVRAVQKNKIIWQTGSWQRSQASFRKAAEIVRSGLIGQVTHVEVGLPSGLPDFARTGEFKTPTAPPPELDYEMWLGPSKSEPYIKARIHKNWRLNYNTGGGQLMDWVGHHVDIAHWGLGFDNSGPSEIEGQGEFPPADAVWNTCTKYRIELKYPQNITMTIAGGYGDIKGGTKWIGSEGWVRVNRGEFEASNPEWVKGKSLPEELRKVKLYETKGHQRNFLDCVKSRQPTITPVETAHHSAIPGHLGQIAMVTGRKINWDVKHEKIIGDAEASKLLTRAYRAPWRIEG